MIGCRNCHAPTDGWRLLCVDCWRAVAIGVVQGVVVSEALRWLLSLVAFRGPQ